MTTADRPPTIAELGRALRAGATSAADLLDRTIRAIRARDPLVNAFVLLDEDGARRAAGVADAELVGGFDRGPLHGIPVAVKDLVDMAGLRTTCGSRSTFGGIAEADAAVITRLRAAGAVIVGKTTLHEFAYGATGDRSAHGPSRNPHDPARMSGGSSGGSAVAVAAGMVPLSVGTDTVGSVRVPAALCGIVGLKPAFNAIASEGVHPLAPGLDHVGLFATTVDDVRTAYQVLAEQPAETSNAGERAEIRVGWIAPGDLAATDPRIETLVREILERSGLPVRATSLPADHAGVAWFEATSALQGSEAFEVHRNHLDEDADLIDPEVLARLRAGGRVSLAQYARAQGTRDHLRALVDGLLEEYDVLALPTVPVTAPPLDGRLVEVAGRELETRAALLSLTHLWNLTGSPAISVPVGLVDRLPVGAQLVTAPGREHILFVAARALEAARIRPLVPTL